MITTSARRQAVRAGDGDPGGSLGMPVLAGWFPRSGRYVVAICCADAAAGSTASAIAIPSPATQFGPQTAADQASHLHLLQLSRKIAPSPTGASRMTLRKPLLYLAGAQSRPTRRSAASAFSLTHRRPERHPAIALCF